MDEHLYQTLIFAGLTHDVGKFLRKEGRTAQDKRPWGRASGRGSHARDSAAFLRAVGADRLPLDWDLLHDAVDCHHENERLAPEHRLWGRLLSRADHYSAYERPETDAEGRQEATLASIFGGLDTGFPLPATRYYRQAPLDLVNHSSPIFPTADEGADATAYHRDITAFREQFEGLLSEGLSLEDLNVSLLSLLETYIWATTSAEHVWPRDVSLFDHLRTTAAIVACLYLYHDGSDQPLSEAHLDDDDTAKFLLVGGDLAGIQGYLYEIANVGVGGGVAKRLRARSFWLAALVDVTAHRLLDELVSTARLPLCALLWSNGGHFVLLAPNLPGVHERLRTLDRAVNEWLYHQAEGDLAMHLAAIPLCGRDFYVAREGDTSRDKLPRSRIGAKLSELANAIQERKSRRLESLLLEDGRWDEAASVYPYESEDYAEGLCQSCHKLPAVSEYTEGGIRYCGACGYDRLVGRCLVQLTHLAYYRQPPEIEDSQLARELDGRRLRFFEGDAERQVLLVDRMFRPQQIPSRPYLVERVAGSEGLVHGWPTVRRYLANYVPTFKDRPDLERRCEACKARRPEKAGCESYEQIAEADHFPVTQSFECLAAAASGEMLLGMLRMDVDRLGLLFQRGMGERNSISRVATLSRMVDLFFGGWVDRTLQLDFEMCYTVYSSGDDLFIVGPWDETVRLAHEIARRFHEYVGENPNVTLSAGLAVTKPGFPIAKAAWQAGEYLDRRAKAGGRARLHLFGTTAVWRQGDPTPEETVDVAELLDDWGVFLDEELTRAAKDASYPFSTSAAHRLLRYAEMCRRWQADGAIHAEELRWLSQLEYDLARNIKPRQYPQWKAHLEGVVEKLQGLGVNKRDVMGKLRMPITWALLKHRR